MGKIVGIWNKLSGAWIKLSKVKKISFIIVLCSLIAAISVYNLSGNKKAEYVPLFTNLDIKDASQMVEKLDERKYTDYKIADNGTALLVPENDVDRLRLDLAIDGALPDSGEGFELFDKSNYAMTDADREILYQRALEGELQRSIQSLEEVDKARIHLALSEESIFMKEQKPATASIILTLKPGRDLVPEQIKGIISLVSGAVKNLPEKNVRVVDSSAHLLSDEVLNEEDTYSSAGSSTRIMDLEKQFENKLEKDLKDLLEQVFGVGKVAVSVKTDLDFDSQDKTRISYDPQEVIRSQEVLINQNGTTTEGQGSSPIDNNTQNYIDENVTEVLDQNGVTSYESTTNNEIGETKTHTTKAPGEVKRITASVVYNGKLNEETQQAMQNIVSAAIGYDERRGDTIQVEGVSFDTSLKDELDQQMQEEEARRQKEAAIKAQRQAASQRKILFVALGVLSVCIIAVLIGLFRSVRKKKRKREPEPESPPMVDAVADEPIPVEDILREEPLINIEPKENKEERSLKEYARKNPDDMADLVRAWILEDEDG